MRKHARHLLIIAAVAVTAFAFSGCVFIASQSATQLDQIGAVQITTTAGGNGQGNEQAQLLIAYRIPTNSSAPASITTTNTTFGGPITFIESSGYESQLTSKSAPPAGQKWVGYISSTVNVPSSHQEFTVQPLFNLQRGADGSAFQGPFNYRVVVGWRIVDGSNPASRPVVCGSPITQETGDHTNCSSDPGDTNTVATNFQQPTQDLGVLDASDIQAVTQGNVARVKYTLDYSGDGNPAPTFDLSATTDLPDATAVTSTPTLTPDEGDSKVRVIFRVPVDTEPGDYDVTLVATLPNGQVRSSTHEIAVTPTTVRCDADAPTIAGTRHDDVLVGTRGPDVIAAYAGDDQVLGLDGNDIICTGRGDDIIRGGGGNDQLAGRRGNDLLTGGSGRNVVDPGPGRDRFIK